MVSSLVITIFIIALIYAFSGILSFIPFFIGLIINIFTFPLDFLQNFYPVGDLPYLVCFVFPLILLVLFIVDQFRE